YSGLTAGTTYHWRVKTKNAQGEYGSYSNCFSFTTLPAPLGAPALLSPANGAFDQPVALTLDWADVAGAVGYELQVGTSCGVGAIYDMTASMFPLGGLDLATTYFWRVRAKDACDQFGPYSTCFSFRTTECDGVVLGPPTLLTPADDAICQPTAGTLDWSDVDGATGYMVEIATPVRARDTHEVTGSEYDYLLLPGTTYIWRVRTKNCDDVYGSYSSSFTFTTVPAAPLPPPALLTPADGATDVPLDGTLTWSAVPGASAYTVRLGTVCGGGAESEVLGTSYDYAGLVLDTTYFWQVKTKDGCGQYGEYSTCFSFRIPVTSTLPTDPIVQEPNGGEVWPAGTQQDIRWTSGAGGDDVRIELLLNGSVCATIAPSTPDDGSFPWTAAQCGGASTGYKVRITNLRTLYFDDSNGTFSIPGQAAIQVISPNGHERLVWGVPYDIVWVSTNGGPTVRIELLKGDEFCAPIEEAAPNTGSYRWTPVFCQGLGGYRIRVTDNLNGVSDRSDQTFIIKHRRAGPTSDQADGETSVTLPNPYTTNGAITIDLWEDGPVRAAIYNVRGQKVRDLLDASLSGGAYEFSWDGRDAAGVRVRTGIYYLRISANGSDYTRKLLYVH
ncbi:MAG: T9SS type A sorting domain-containing protein, partial [Candidatus Eisenbacteria bacterium]|nr:T9SS type A sorting domain-containing protein [Candidatus Eisenbacteria bacterium]